MSASEYSSWDGKPQGGDVAAAPGTQPAPSVATAPQPPPSSSSASTSAPSSLSAMLPSALTEGKRPALISLVLSSIFLLFIMIGIAIEQLAMTSGQLTIDITFFHVSLCAGGSSSSCQHYSIDKGVSCAASKSHLHAGAAFGIISVLLQFVITVIIGVQFYNSPDLLPLQFIRKIPGNALYLMAGLLFTLMLTWCMSAAVLTSTFCDTNFGKAGYGYGGGFGLLVSTWVFTIILIAFYWMTGLHVENMMQPMERQRGASLYGRAASGSSSYPQPQQQMQPQTSGAAPQPVMTPPAGGGNEYSAPMVSS